MYLSFKDHPSKLVTKIGNFYFLFAIPGSLTFVKTSQIKQNFLKMFLKFQNNYYWLS